MLYNIYNFHIYIQILQRQKPHYTDDDREQALNTPNKAKNRIPSVIPST